MLMIPLYLYWASMISSRCWSTKDSRSPMRMKWFGRWACGSRTPSILRTKSPCLSRTSTGTMWVFLVYSTWLTHVRRSGRTPSSNRPSRRKCFSDSNSTRIWSSDSVSPDSATSFYTIRLTVRTKAQMRKLWDRLRRTSSHTWRSS